MKTTAIDNFCLNEEEFCLDTKRNFKQEFPTYKYFIVDVEPLHTFRNGGILMLQVA